LILYPIVARAFSQEKETLLIHSSDYTGLALSTTTAIVVESGTPELSDPPSQQAQSPDTSGFSALILETFPDAPYMLDVARCESSVRQYLPSGEVLMGGGGGNYIGIFQIGSQWVSRAKSMGMDVYTPEGNIAFARFLFDDSGPSSQWECFHKI